MSLMLIGVLAVGEIANQLINRLTEFKLSIRKVPLCYPSIQGELWKTVSILGLRVISPKLKGCL